MICYKCNKMLLNRETDNKFIIKGLNVVLCDNCEEKLLKGELV